MFVCVLKLLHKQNVASHAILIMSDSTISWVLLTMILMASVSLLPPCVYTHTTPHQCRSKDRIIYYHYVEKDDVVLKNLTTTVVKHNCSGSVSSNDW